VRLVAGQRDDALGARVVGRRPLRYDDGARPEDDRPAHVRAGSALGWLGTRLAVVQDDASFIALVEPGRGAVRAVTLPAGPGGRRQFDEGRGNKAHKLDLEACFTVPRGRGTWLVALGSGSTPARETIVVVDERQAVRLVDGAPLYARLRAHADFSGSELNVEGAVVRGDSLVLLQRGNGAPRDGRQPVDASAEIVLGELVTWLEDPVGPAPALRNVTRYELCTAAGERLGFTDAALIGDAIHFLAAAERSPDATRDGPVSAVAIGVLEPGRSARWAPIRSESGDVLVEKVEGLVADPAGPGLAWAVVDRDDPAAPAELLSLALATGT
jgi:hypothetical protein